MKVLLFVLLVSGFAQIATASVKCKELKEELAAMKNAQTQIMNGLISNHEIFASSLEEYAEIAGSVQPKEPLLSLSKNMKQSARVTRNRGLQGRQMTARLNAATEDLFKRVSLCLK